MSIPGKNAQVLELEQVKVGDEIIRCFELSSCGGGVKIRLCSLGAAISHYFVNNPDEEVHDDIVLGYSDVESMYNSKNPVYFGAIVGRVANRIKEGKFDLNGKSYKLEVNNPPNHLHGGSGGFSHKVWEVEKAGIIDNYSYAIPFVRFSITSPDGDQGYPGSVRVTATYSLRPAIMEGGATLSLEMKAYLLDGCNLSTPVNLSQHSYWNLSDKEKGILDHSLQLEADAYTPIDSFSIPTRQVLALENDPVMSFARKPRLLGDAIRDYGVNKVKLPLERVNENLKNRMTDTPFGIDHNYVVRQQPFTAMPKVATLTSDNGTTLSVHSTAPGVQVYTANYLGSDDNASFNHKKKYLRWSGVCLETQHFPDSISESDAGIKSSDFAKGRCPILSPRQRKYHHVVEYTVCNHVNTSPAGSDTENKHYESVESMWAAQQGLSSWYRKSRDYYEDNCPSTVEGVLGNLGWLSNDDIEGSRQFVEQLGITSILQSGVACECGAGIGRVTKGLLLDICKGSDVIESSSRLLSAAPDYIGNESHRCRFFCSELQNWSPSTNKYALVWIQWTAIYLTDNDFVAFLKRCSQALVPGGCIVLKENVCQDETFVLDVDDASITRSIKYWHTLIFQAGLRIVRESWQEDFPDDIFPVVMLALQPIDWSCRE